MFAKYCSQHSLSRINDMDKISSVQAKFLTVALQMQRQKDDKYHMSTQGLTNRDPYQLVCATII